MTMVTAQCSWNSIFFISGYSGGDNSEDKSNEASYRISRENDIIDTKYGFDRVKDSNERTGYLINMHSVSKQIIRLDL